MGIAPGIWQGFVGYSFGLVKESLDEFTSYWFASVPLEESHKSDSISREFEALVLEVVVSRRHFEWTGRRGSAPARGKGGW